MKEFSNYRHQKIKLSKDTWLHIQEAHSEIEIKQISECPQDPDEVRASRKNPRSELYYLLRLTQRYTCVVVKKCPDGNFISTALTTTKPKIGELIYQKRV